MGRFGLGLHNNLSGAADPRCLTKGAVFWVRSLYKECQVASRRCESESPRLQSLEAFARDREGRSRMVYEFPEVRQSGMKCRRASLLPRMVERHPHYRPP